MNGLMQSFTFGGGKHRVKDISGRWEIFFLLDANCQAQPLGVVGTPILVFYSMARFTAAAAVSIKVDANHQDLPLNHHTVEGYP